MGLGCDVYQMRNGCSFSAFTVVGTLLYEITS